ncbi:helix-turn-helix transcriptional regulator [Caulifigura coniformis]|uniref:helix-turn-helix transcriptional regulator n=1 Tax=Caulifigura coniformis TaxID=2527983 RepID=UPI00119DEF24
MTKILKRRLSSTQQHAFSSALLTIKDLGRLLPASRRTIYRLVKDGDLPPPIRIGSRPRWLPSQISEWLVSKVTWVDDASDGGDA